MVAKYHIEKNLFLLGFVNIVVSCVKIQTHFCLTKDFVQKTKTALLLLLPRGKNLGIVVLLKKDDIRIKKLGEKLSEKYKKGELKPSWLGRTHTKETKKKMSESARNNPYQRKCKSTVYYNGQRFDSSWEIKLAQLLDENNIVWEKPKPLLWIDRNNKKHHYFADFYLPNYNVYLDPKNNYCFKVQKEKIDILRKTYKNILFLKEEEIDITYILLYIKYIQIFNVNG